MLIFVWGCWWSNTPSFLVSDPSTSGDVQIEFPKCKFRSKPVYKKGGV